MELKEIVSFWSMLRKNSHQKWVHPDDETLLLSGPHSFNLHFPVSPYVGDILRAPIVTLGANTGFDPGVTPIEFPNEKAIRSYVNRVCAPSDSDWSSVARYYGSVNSGPLLTDGRAALINASPYRSVKISAEPEIRRMLKRLPSLALNRRWLLEALLPLAEAGKRLIVVKRGGLWELPKSLRESRGVVFDRAPISPQITSVPWAAIRNFQSALG